MKKIYLVVQLVPYEGNSIEYITTNKKDLKKFLKELKAFSGYLYGFTEILVVDSNMAISGTFRDLPDKFFHNPQEYLDS